MMDAAVSTIVARTIVQVIHDHGLESGAGIVTPGSRFIDDLGMDSVDVIEIVRRLEDQLHIQISDDGLTEHSRVSDLVAMVSSIVRERDEREAREVPWEEFPEEQW